jgi:hypothetical protein
MPSRISSAVVAALLVPGAIVAVSLGTAQPAAAAICATRTTHDINHDGKADVIVGQPFRKAGDLPNVGAATVMRGASGGLTATSNQLLRITDAGETNAEDDDTGLASAVGFFDGDCFADAIVGVPGDGNGSLLYYKGSSTGLKSPVKITAAQLHAHARGVGNDFAVGDFNHDGYDDVAIGAYESDNGGGVAILYGSSTGLVISAPAFFDQSTPGVPGSPSAGDEFGLSLAAGDFNGDHFADLAIGVPGEGLSGVVDAGDVTILYGTSIGLSGNHSTLWDQNSPGVPGTPEVQDQFGAALAAGDVTGDGKADLVVGDPNEGIGSQVLAGEIVLLKGSSGGISGTGSQVFDQNSTGVPGTSEETDEFGKSVTVGDFNGDGKADVAVGVPGEGVGALDHAGCVDVLKGTSSGLTGTGSVAWDQDSTGVPGTVEEADQFGASVLALKLTGGSRADLLIGTPTEDSDGFADNGSVTVLLNNSSGLTGTGAQAWSAKTLVGGAVTTAEFGLSLG